MLSLLIPTYNYNVYPFVRELIHQANTLVLDFEIIVIDDASSKFVAENEQIENMDNVQFIPLTKNVGRIEVTIFRYSS